MTSVTIVHPSRQQSLKDSLYCICRSVILDACDETEFSYGVPLSLIPNTMFLGSVNVYEFSTIVVEINFESLYDVVLSMKYCHCVYNYGTCCNCIDIVASMFIRKDVHRVIAQLRGERVWPTPTALRVVCAGYQKSFEILMHKHEEGGKCLCDNFADKLGDINWDDIASGDSQTDTEIEHIFNNSVQEPPVKEKENVDQEPGDDH